MASIQKNFLREELMIHNCLAINCEISKMRWVKLANRFEYTTISGFSILEEAWILLQHNRIAEMK